MFNLGEDVPGMMCTLYGIVWNSLHIARPERM